MKMLARQEALDLRKKGYSYSYISSIIGVSKGTLSKWLAEIPYTPNATTIKTIGLARARSGEAKAALKQASFKKAKALAKDDLGNLSRRDMMLVGLGIYMGEGEKNNTVGVINSDPRVIAYIIQWLCLCFGLSISNFTLAVHGYPDTDMTAAKRYWSKISGIPVSQFGASQIDNRKNKKPSKKGLCPYGTAHIRVRSAGKNEFGVLLSRRIKAMSDIIIGPRD